MSNYALSKNTIPSNFSFVLKRSVLDAHLASANISFIACVYYNHGIPNGPILSAHYCGEDKKGWFARGKASISVRTIQSELSHQVEAIVSSSILPALIAWLKELEHAGNTRRGPDREFNAYIENGVPRIQST